LTLPDLIQSHYTKEIILGIAYMVLEYALGKTKRVKAASTLELLIDGVAALLKRITVKRTKGE